MKSPALFSPFQFLLFACIILFLSPASLLGQQKWRTTKDLSCTYFTGLNVAFSWSGECKEGKLHGVGKLNLYDEQDKSLGYFEGEMIAGVLQGKATRYYADGKKYIEGNFKDGMLDGDATIWFNTGQIFSGNYSKGKRLGPGTQTNKNGTKFVGNWVGTKMEGPGKVYVGPDEHLFVSGTYKNSELEGEAIIHWTHGVKYKGEMKKSLRHGKGEMILPVGHRYIGAWEEGLMHGPGKLIFASGYELEGNWEKGRLEALPISIFPRESLGPIDMSNIFPGQELLLHMTREAQIEPGKKTEEIQFKNFSHLNDLEIQVEAPRFREQKFSMDARRWNFFDLKAIVYKVDTTSLNAEGEEIIKKVVETDVLVRDSVYMFLRSKDLGYYLNGIKGVIVGTGKAGNTKENNKRQGLFKYEMRRQWDRFSVFPVNTDPYNISYNAGTYFDKPLLTHGQLYDGIRFTAPEGEGNLVFSFYSDNLKSVSWYILPREGEMNGFRFIQKGKPHPSTSAHFKGKTYMMQTIPAKEFVPGKEYVIHFSFPNVRPRTIDISLNFITSSSMGAKKYFEYHFLAQENYQKAQNQLDQKQFDKALPLVQKAIELDPENAFYTGVLGQVYFGKEEYEKAIKSFRLAEKLGDKILGNKLKRALSHFQLLEYDEAIPLLKEVLSKNSDHAFANYTLALCYINLEKPKESCPYLGKAYEQGIEDAQKLKEKLCK